MLPAAFQEISLLLLLIGIYTQLISQQANSVTKAHEVGVFFQEHYAQRNRDDSRFPASTGVRLGTQDREKYSILWPWFHKTQDFRLRQPEWKGSFHQEYTPQPGTAVRTQLHCLRYKCYSQYTVEERLLLLASTSFSPSGIRHQEREPLPEHNKHEHLSYSQHERLLRALTATLYQQGEKKKPKN